MDYIKQLNSREKLTGGHIQEKLLKVIFSHLQKDFVWFSSLTDQQNFCSDNISSVIGYTAEEVKSFNEKRLTICVKEDFNRIRETLNEFLTDPAANSVLLDYKIETKNKSTISVIEKIYADRDSSGELINLCGIVSDATEQKESEERLFTAISELQQLNEAKDKFVSRISHDLRSPFTSIIGFAEVMINDSQIPEKEKLDYLNYILNSSKNLLHLVNQLSEIIKLQTFRIRIEPERLNVNRLIHYAVAGFTAQLVDKNILMKVEVSDHVHVNADERLFLTLITALISNAIKYSKPGSKINISNQEFNDDFVEIVVKDYGIGISEKNKLKLFKIDQIFFTEGTKGEKGVGLGLLLCKEIVEKHGGNIWFYSSQNEGSEFHITLPISKNTILLILPDEAERKTFENILNDDFPQLNIVAAKDGYEALNMMSILHPSIIVLDHDLPMMSGLQFLKSLSKSDKKIKTSYLVIEDGITEEIKNSYNKIGVTEFLSKPVTTKVVQRKIKTVVDAVS